VHYRCKSTLFVLYRCSEHRYNTIKVDLHRQCIFR